MKALNIFEGINKAAKAGYARGLSGQQPDAVADDCELHRLPYAVSYSQGRIVFLNKRDHSEGRETLAQQIEAELRGFGSGRVAP